jgi:hypothetical protein
MNWCLAYKRYAKAPKQQHQMEDKYMDINIFLLEIFCNLMSLQRAIQIAQRKLDGWKWILLSLNQWYKKTLKPSTWMVEDWHHQGRWMFVVCYHLLHESSALVTFVPIATFLSSQHIIWGDMLVTFECTMRMNLHSPFIMYPYKQGCYLFRINTNALKSICMTNFEH